MSVTVAQPKLNPGDHAVHFYRDDAELADTVGRYLAEALGESAVALAIASAPHIKAFERRLAVSGTDVKGALHSGRLIVLDAEATLAKISLDGQLDRQAFDYEVGGLIRRAAPTGAVVRVYGEMVDLLWQAGDVSVAIELETLWNELIDELHFSLLCAYRSLTTTAPEHERSLREICQLHSAVSSAPGACTVLSPANGARLSREFRPEPDAPRAARCFLDQALQRLGRAGTPVEDARLALSELVTNAVQHARSPIVVSIQARGPGIRLAVHDQSPAQPKLCHPAPDEPSGRGLQIVAALSSDWGVETTTDGKTVWAEI